MTSLSSTFIWGHLGTKHDRPPLNYEYLGQEKYYSTRIESLDGVSISDQHPLTKVSSDLEFMLNWKSYDANSLMFWISLCGTPKEAKEYEYTIKIESSSDKKAGRTKLLLTGTGECLSCEVSHEDVKTKTTNVLLFFQDMLKIAAEGNDENKLEWRLVIRKK